VCDIWWPLGSAWEGRVGGRKWCFEEGTELVDDVGDDVLVGLKQSLAFLVVEQEDTISLPW